MKKKIFSILLALCLCVSVFAGCSLVEIDEKSYQDAIVATITFSDGEKDNIDKRELLLAYSSYGYNYNSDGGNYNGALKTTLNTVIDQHVTIKAVKNYYKDLDVNKDEDEENDEPLLNDNETSYLWEETRSSIFDNIEENYFEILDYDNEDQNEDNSTTDEGVVYKKYNSTVDFENGIIKNKTTTLSVRNDPNNLKVLKVDGEDGKEYVYDYESQDYDFKTELFNALKNAMGEDSKERAVRDWKNAINQYVDVIERNFSYLDYKTDDEWLKFEIDRVYNILKNNYLVEKYTEIYNEAQNRSNNYSNIQVEDVLNRYKEKVEEDYRTYSQNPSSYSDAILNSTSDVDYFLKTANENYFYVSAIKVNISSKQQARLDEAKRSGNYLEIKNAEEEIFGSDTKAPSVLATKRNVAVNFEGEVTGNGGKTSEKVNVLDLIENLKSDIAKFNIQTRETMTNLQYEEAVSDLTAQERGDVEKQNQAIETWLEAHSEATMQTMTLQQREEAVSGLTTAELGDAQKQYEAVEAWLKKINSSSARQRASVFRDYMFKYSDDDTTKNSDYDIVFGVNGNTVLANSTFSENENVKEAIKNLYKSKPEIGQTTDLVKVDDGYYIFFYAGEVENLGEVANGKFVVQNDFVYRLRETRTSLLSDKTLFDVIYDELYSNYSDNFSVFQNLDIEALKDPESVRCIVTSINISGDELDN